MLKYCYEKCQTQLLLLCNCSNEETDRQKSNLNTKEQDIIVHHNVNEGLYLQRWYCMEEDAQIRKHANAVQ